MCALCMLPQAGQLRAYRRPPAAEAPPGASAGHNGSLRQPLLGPSGANYSSDEESGQGLGCAAAGQEPLPTGWPGFWTAAALVAKASLGVGRWLLPANSLRPAWPC